MEASLATQVVSFLGKTSGRDKLYRTCQYGSRIVWWCLQEGHRDPTLVQKLKGLDSNLSTSRKLLRIGKSFEMLKAAQKSVHLSDPFLQFTITFSNVNKALYLLLDHLMWFHRVGLVDIDKKYYGDITNRFYLTTLILSLARDIYGIVDVLGTLTTTKSRKASSDSKESSEPCTNGSATRPHDVSNGSRNHVRSAQRSSIVRIAMTLYRYHLSLLLDTLKNLSDLVLPLSYLGYINVSSGLQGLLGLISSLIGVMTVWNAKFKLSP